MRAWRFMITKLASIAAALSFALGCGSTPGDLEDESAQTQGLETTAATSPLRVSIKAYDDSWGRQHFFEIHDEAVHLFRSRTHRSRAAVDADLSTLLDGAKNESLLFAIEPRGQVEPTWYFTARSAAADVDDKPLGTSAFFETRALAEQASKDLQRSLRVTPSRVD